MAEPEGLLVEGTRLATIAARDLWWRLAPPRECTVFPLVRIRQRLELFLGALYVGAPSILPADPPPAPTWLARLAGRAPRHLTRRTATAATDGARIWLPRAVESSEGDARAADTYRLLAVEMAARADRGTPRHAPPGGSDLLVRDLYLLAEAVAIDRAIAESFPGLAPDLHAARRAALDERPPLDRLTPVERAVERMVCDVLRTELRARRRDVLVMTTPSESSAWARETALRLRTHRGRYRGIATVPLWGHVVREAGERPTGLATDDGASPPSRLRSAQLRRRPELREAGDDEDDARPGTWMVRLDDPMESAEDPMGLQRPADRDESPDPSDLADSLSELPEARIVRTPSSPREVLESDGPGVARAGSPERRAGGVGVIYPEWDCRIGAYRAHGAVVRPGIAAIGATEWVDRVMGRHATLVRQIRRRFDTLRPRRVRLSRQTDGTELDLSAYVTAFADGQAGQAGEDRFYTAERPARRDLAIALLIDTSESTDGWVGASLRIVDVEKEALVVLIEALDALGDLYAVLAFSGHGPASVRLLTVKAFEEPLSTAVRRRVAAIEPGGYTRTGAAIRHASMLLGAQRARYRLLLVLSDGKPNDVDEYEGRYGIEDTRQAIAEARLQGIVPFCLTVDREAPAYLPSIFGTGGYTLLRRPELLPVVLVDAVRRLMSR